MFEQDGSIGGYLTVAAVSRLLRATYPQAYTWIRKSKVKTRKIGAALLVRVEDLPEVEKAGRR
jgi:hypothetical protein